MTKYEYWLKRAARGTRGSSPIKIHAEWGRGPYEAQTSQNSNRTYVELCGKLQKWNKESVTHLEMHIVNNS